ncbi:membrane associated guanylate kinase, WW and PDZ domain containing protein magi [Aphomia sociella]
MAQNLMDSDRLSSAGISTHSSGTAGTVGGSVIGVRVGDPGHKREDEDEYNLGPLPPMWEKAFTPSGETYFIDHNTGTSHWLDPRLARVRKHSLGECGEDELPYGWERVTDERYGSYYVDHINRRTQYENPVLQARRLRAEKLAAENGGSQPNGPTPTGELRGERFTLTLTKSTQGLGFTLIGAEGIPETEGYLQIRSIVPNSPAWIDGALRPGDVVVGVGPRGVRGLSQAQVAQMFQSIAPGTDVTLHLVRGYPLSFDSEDPNTRVLSTRAVDANTPPSSDAVAMQQLTRALRTRFNLESPKHADANPGRDETDAATVALNQHGPHSPSQRRLMSRSFDLDELPAAETDAAPPRCSSADHLLSIANGPGPGAGAGRELRVRLRRGAAGFGFTIADSVHGQKVKKVLDRSRCAGLREGDLLLQIGDTDVRHSPHQHVVQVLKECPALHETSLRVWRRATPTRSRSATRALHAAAPSNNNQLGRSKTPTAEQLRSPSLQQNNMHDMINGMNSVEATYAVPEHKGRERESLIDRRRRSSTPGGRLTLPVVTPWAEPQNDNQWCQPERETWVDNSNNIRNWAENAQKWDENGQKWDVNGQKWDVNGQKWDVNGQKWDEVTNSVGWDGNPERWNGNWGEVPTPTVHVDMNAAYCRSNASVADSSDNGGFPEDGMVHSPTTAALGALGPRPQRHSPTRRTHSPDNSTGHLRSHSPSNNSTTTEQLLANSPSTRLQSQSPSNNSSNGRIKGSPLRLRSTSPSRRMHSPTCYEGELPQSAPLYVANYPQVSGGGADPCADVVVRLARGAAGFGFRIVGGTEDGSRVAVGYVVPGGPAAGLLRAGDLLTSVDGRPLAGASHARAVACVARAAARGHVTLGVRHNRADIQPLGLPAATPHAHQPLLTAEPTMHQMPPASYNILHPAPMYPPAHAPMYGVQYDSATGGWASVPYDVTVTRSEGEGFGFVVISSTNKATSTIGQLIPNSPASRCGLLHVGDTIVAINRIPIRNLPHPEVVALIKHSGTTVTLTVLPPDGRVD